MNFQSKKKSFLVSQAGARVKRLRAFRFAVEVEEASESSCSKLSEEKKKLQ